MSTAASDDDSDAAPPPVPVQAESSPAAAKGDAAGGGSSRWNRLFAPSLPMVVWLVMFLRLTVTPAASDLVSFDGDAVLHVLLGRLMIARGGLLPTEPTNFLAPDRPFIAHEWLCEVVMAASWELLGWAGPVLLTAAVVATVHALLLGTVRAGGVGLWPSLATCLLAMPVVNSHAHARPHVLTWLFVLVWIELIRRYESGRLTFAGWMVRGVPLMVVWANVHAGFLAAFYLLGLWGLAAIYRGLTDPAPQRPQAWRTFWGLVLGGFVALAASGANPWGFSLHVHFLTWLADARLMNFTSEFMSPDFRSGGKSILVYLLVMVAALAASSRRPTPSEWIPLLGAAVMALQSGRHAALLALVSAPLLGRQLQGWLDDLSKCDGPAASGAQGVEASSRRLDADFAARRGWLLPGIAMLSVALLAGPLGIVKIGIDPAKQPVEAADYVAAHPDQFRGRMLNPFTWGAYLAWRMYPEKQVFINSWHDHLGPELIQLWMGVDGGAPGWEEVLRRYHVNWIVHPPQGPLVWQLDKHPGWRRVHADPTAVLYVRVEPLPDPPKGPSP